MKIIHIIHGLSMGGAETLLKDYALNINKKYQFIILCLNRRKEETYGPLLEKNGVKIIYVCDFINNSVANGYIHRVYKKIKQYLCIKQIISAEKPDIIHSHLSVNRFLKFSKPPKNTKLFYTVHTEPEALWNKTDFIKKKELKATRWLSKKYNMKFIVLHEDMEKKIRNLFKTTNTIILNNGIDLSRFRQRLNKRDIRLKEGLPLDAFVIGHIGRFSKTKNQQFLIDIFQCLNRKNSNTFLLMIGDGPDKEIIENKLTKMGLNDKYKVLSGRFDIPELLDAMDVFVFPSLHEGLGISYRRSTWGYG